MALQPQAQLVPSVSAAPRLLHDPVPEFLSSLFGFNRAQVERWARHQLDVVERVRARILDLEEEVRRLRQLVASQEQTIAAAQLDFALPPTTPHVGARRPRHLRREVATSAYPA